MTDPANESLWALVLAGGDGTRLQSLTYLIAGRYDRKLWIVEPVTPAAYPPA